MHINMKYYIVTIGAIFIALGIGILVGFNLNYDQELSKQQSQVIKDLDKKFVSLKETNDKLEKDLSSLEKDYNQAIEFINKNIDRIIDDELSNKNIGIISTNQNNDYTSEIKDAITKASGKVAFEIVLKDSINDKNKLQEVSEKINTEIQSSQDAINYILEALKVEGASDKLIYLQELGMIKLNSLDNDYLSYDSVVVAGESEQKDIEEEFKKVDKVLIQKLKEENKNVVGVQKSDTKYSYINLYKNDQVSTIDNIDEGVGKLSLVLTLKEGNSLGSFGRLESADSLLPYKK